VVRAVTISAVLSCVLWRYCPIFSLFYFMRCICRREPCLLTDESSLSFNNFRRQVCAKFSENVTCILLSYVTMHYSSTDRPITEDDYK
jgi:hypothetical protein